MKTGKVHPLLLVHMVIIIMTTSVFAQMPNPATVAETSDYTATSRYADVMSFIHALQKQSTLMRVETICTSTQGRTIPLLVIGDPVPATPQSLKMDDRLVVYIQANIHAGEVEGKEAVLALMRDILQDESHPFLKDLVILVAPIFNADGNEPISKNNRRRQHGPSEGVGVRHNGQELDLNRDAIKLESPEVRGMIKNVLNRWDPALFIDCHTTNGSYHEEPVTYTWAFNPNGDNEIIDYMRLKMMPFIQKNMKKKYDVLSVVYGNFMDYENPEKGWETAGPQCRYITNYVGLRNRLSILNENYSYADYKDRVLGCYAFLRSCLEHCQNDKQNIQKMIAKADDKVISRGMDPNPSDIFAVEYKQEAYDEKVIIRGYEMKVTPREGTWPRVERTDVKKTYEVPYYCKYVPTRTVPFASGYFITTPDKMILKNLLSHGITVDVLDEPVTTSVQGFKVSEVKANERLYQGHYMNKVKGEYFEEDVTFPAGTYFVSTAQRLGTVAAYLLEPESDDGLFVWNYFDRYLVYQWGRRPKTSPVFRLLKPVPLVKTTIR